MCSGSMHLSRMPTEKVFPYGEQEIRGKGCLKIILSPPVTLIVVVVLVAPKSVCGGFTKNVIYGHHSGRRLGSRVTSAAFSL